MYQLVLMTALLPLSALSQRFGQRAVYQYGQMVFVAAPVGRVAAAGALYSTVRGVGQTLGATTIAALLAAGSGSGAVPALIAAGLCSLEALRSMQPR